MLTGNVRAWRRVLEMRASQHADVPISKVMLCAYEILSAASPVLFGDYEVEVDQGSSRGYSRTDHHKV